MSIALPILILVLCVVASALYSGSETGLYGVSRVRVDLDARRGQRTARLAQWLIRDESALLVTILIGNNLALELATHAGEDLVELLAVPPALREVALTVLLTPFLFLFAEVLPKDVFRRRPHALALAVSPFLVLSRIAYWPLERFLRALTALLERAAGLQPEAVSRYRGRQVVYDLLEEGTRSGVLPPRAQVLAHNALQLRSIPISRAMRPWADVHTLSEDTSDSLVRQRLASSDHSRLPVEGSGRVLGYLHQLDVLLAPEGTQAMDTLRPLPTLDPETPVAKALFRLRASGQRIALVGTALAPLGIITLKDLVEEISGDLAVW